MPNATNIALIPLLPLAAFVLLGLFGRKYLKGSAGLIGTALLLIISLCMARSMAFISSLSR